MDEVEFDSLGILYPSIELAGVCFGISAFVRRGGAGIGLGIAAILYFLNLIANIAEVVRFLKYITPFGYRDGADIITNDSLNGAMVSIGIVIGMIGITIAYMKYTKKDIQ